MPHAEAFAKNPASVRSIVVEKNHAAALQFAKLFWSCATHVVGKAAPVARDAERKAEHTARARMRAARHTDLPLPLAGAAEQGATAAGGDAMTNKLSCLKYVVYTHS